MYLSHVLQLVLKPPTSNSGLLVLAFKCFSHYAQSHRTCVSEDFTEFTDLQAVLCDCMVPLVGRVPTDLWARAFLNDEELLAVLPCLATTCRDWRDAVHSLIEFAALRIATIDFARVNGRGISRLGSQRGGGT